MSSSEQKNALLDEGQTQAFLQFPFTCTNLLASFLEIQAFFSVTSLGIIATEQSAGSVKHFELCGEQKLQAKYKVLLVSDSPFIPILSKFSLSALRSEISNKEETGALLVSVATSLG